MSRMEASPFPEFENWPEVLELLPLALDLARHMRKYAHHYDDRRYGAVIMGATQENTIELFVGANRNDSPGQNPSKECAEEAAFKKVTPNIVYIPVIVVSGHHQADTHSGIELETTPPCGNCRHKIKTSKQTDESTLLLSYHPYEPIVEANTLQETLDIHSGNASPETSNVLREEELDDISFAPERYSRLRAMFSPSAYLARLALIEQSGVAATLVS